MNRPKWLESYIQNKPGVKDQVTVLGNRNAMPGVMNTGMRQMGGGSMYMGAGPDNRVQPQRPVMMDTLALHEGETVVNANDTAAAGGPQVVKSAVDQAKMMRQQNMPGTLRLATGTGFDAIRLANDPNKAGTISAAQDTANTVTGIKNFANAISNQQAAPLPNLGFVNDPNRVASVAAQDTANTVTGIKNMSAAINAQPAPVTNFSAARLANDPNKPGTVSYAQDTANTVAGLKNMNAAVNAQSVAPMGKMIPSFIMDPNRVSGNIAAANAQDTANTVAGLKNMNAAVKAQAQPVIPTVASTTTAPGVAPQFINNTLKGSMQRVNDLATGNSAMYDRFANSAFNQLDPRLAAQDTALRMQIANNPNMTSGGVNTALAAGARDAGSQQSQLAGNLAINAANLAINANQDAFNMATGQQAVQRNAFESDREYAERVRTSDREFNYNRDMTAMGAMLTAGDIDGYAALASKTLGINVNKDALKDSNNLTTFNTGMGQLNKLLIANGAPKLDDVGIRNALELMWRGEGNTTPMDETWANNTLTAISENMNPWNQALNIMPEQEARDRLGNEFFDGVNGVGGFVDPVTGQKGYKGFQLAFARELTTGGMTRDPVTGAVTWNNGVDSVINTLLSGVVPPTPAAGSTSNIGAITHASDVANATPITDWTIGKAITLPSGRGYTVAAPDATGDGFILADARGNLFNSDGTALSAADKAEVGVYTGRDGAAYYNGSPISITGGTGMVKVDPKDETKGTDSTGKAVIIKDGKAYYPGTITVGDRVYKDGVLQENKIPGAFTSTQGTITTNAAGSGIEVVNQNNIPAPYTWDNYIIDKNAGAFNPTDANGNGQFGLDDKMAALTLEMSAIQGIVANKNTVFADTMTADAGQNINVISAWLTKGNVAGKAEALTYAKNQVIAGNGDYAKLPGVMDAVKKSAVWSGNASAGSVVTKDGGVTSGTATQKVDFKLGINPPPQGSVIMIGDVPYLIASVPHETYVKNYTSPDTRDYTFILKNIITGEFKNGGSSWVVSD